MLTEWGRQVEAERTSAAPHPEHPRPQLTGRPWTSLNGVWEHAFSASDAAPVTFDGPILVPFSPEAPLSGVGRQLQPHERLWYRRTFEAPDLPAGARLLLHLGAVDQSCTVWVDGVEVGRHVGGYLPFTLDVTEALASTPEHELLLLVRDVSETAWHARGKQRLDRGGIWYTAQSGIWQSVWLEVVPQTYVADLVLTADLDRELLEVTVSAAGATGPRTAHVVVRAEGEDLAEAEVPVDSPTAIHVPGARRWSPEDPYLHEVRVALGDDTVRSYAAMRSVGTGTDAAGHRRLLLNGSPYAHVGVLDQGYWPDGLLTPPSDAAMIADLQRVKELGFTMVRKHAKVEPLRWYHHCDRLGLLVWQDVVNGGGRYRPRAIHRERRKRRLPDRLYPLFGRGDAAGRAEFLREVDDTVRLLRLSPSVVAWTPFNEGWGQFDANAVARRVHRLDPSRVVHHASGWIDQGGGDVRSFHAYRAPFTMPARQRGRRGRRVVALTEYGGYSLPVPGHQWGDRVFGHRRHKKPKALARAFTTLHEALAQECRAGLSATVWTQLTDVEDELNGLVTYDREVEKLDPELVRRLTRELREAMVGG